MEKEEVKELTEENYRFMDEAIEEAKKAYEKGEVPIGAVVVKDGQVIGRGHNLRESSNDPTTHAEMIAIKDAAQKMESWRLVGCDIYVTLEPCPMCAGAIINSRIEGVYYGAYDPKAGCAGTFMNLLLDERFNHQAEVYPEVKEEECANLLKSFFREIRERRKREKEKAKKED